jgi:hypothetical protein
MPPQSLRRPSRHRPCYPRLTELHLEGGGDKIVDFTQRVWDIMANHRLPALSALTIETDSESPVSSLLEEGAEGGDGRLGRAFEAVAGTLLRLTLSSSREQSLSAPGCHKVGEAIGKLRRLRYLYLKLSTDGRAYAAMGRGLAASGGCPELFDLDVSGLERNLEGLTREPSLILPSVRNLLVCATCSDEGADEEAAAVVLWAGSGGLQISFRIRCASSSVRKLGCACTCMYASAPDSC